jgi:hypothetical protein
LREEDSLAEPVAVPAVKERKLPTAAVGFISEAIGTVSGSGAEVARSELLVDEVAREASEGVAPVAKENVSIGLLEAVAPYGVSVARPRGSLVRV